MNAEEKKYYDRIKLIKKDYLLENEDVLRQNTAGIVQDFINRGLSNTTVCVNRQLKVHFEHITNLVNHIINSQQQDFPDIPLDGLKNQLCVIVDEEYKKLIPIANSCLLKAGLCQQNNINGYNKQINDTKEKAKERISTKIVLLKQKADSQGKTNRMPNVKRVKHLSSGWQQTIIGLSVTIIIAVVGWLFFSSEKTSNRITNTTVNFSGKNSGDIAGRDINNTINNYVPNDKTSSSEKPREVDPSENIKLSTQKDNDKLTEAKLKVGRLIKDFDTAINDVVENYSKEVNRIKQHCAVAGMFNSSVHIDMQVENIKIHKKKLDDACKTLDRGTEDIMLEKFKKADIEKISDMREDSDKIKGVHQKYEKAKNDFEENVREMNKQFNHNRPMDFN